MSGACTSGLNHSNTISGSIISFQILLHVLSKMLISGGSQGVYKQHAPSERESHPLTPVTETDQVFLSLICFVY